MPQSGVRTRLHNNIVVPKQQTYGRVCYSLKGRSAFYAKPTSNIEALEQPEWKEAMDVEYAALKWNKTWHLVPPYRGKNVIDCKWVFKLKQKSDDTIDRHKTRLVAKATICH